MQSESIVSAIVAAGGGFSLAMALAKYAVQRALRDLQDVVTEVQKLRESLAVFSVRLEALAEHEATLKDHARKFAFFEGRGCKTTA